MVLSIVWIHLLFPSDFKGQSMEKNVLSNLSYHREPHLALARQVGQSQSTVQAMSCISLMEERIDHRSEPPKEYLGIHSWVVFREDGERRLGLQAVPSQIWQ